MSASISILQNTVIVALGSFLKQIVPGASAVPPLVEIVFGQDNRTPEPTADNFIVMTPIFLTRLETTSNIYQDTYDPVGNPSGINAACAPTQLTVQLDFHGPAGGDNAQIFTTLFRDQYGCDYFSQTTFTLGELTNSTGANITANGNNLDVPGLITAAPLYTSDPRQVPFDNGENQIEYRWSVDAEIQINPVVTVSQGFASNLGPVTLKIVT